MNIIDFHAHIFPDDLASRAIEKLKSNAAGSVNYTDGTAAGLLSSMKQSGVSCAVTLPIATKISQVRNINENSITQKSQQFIPFGTLHPLMDFFEEEILYLKNNQIKGIKLHPEYQNFYIDEPRFYPIYERLADSNIILQLHAGKDPGPFSCDHATPDAIRKISKLFPKLTIVAAHLGGWKMWDEVEQLLCTLPVYFDTSAVCNSLSPEQFIRIVTKHGCEKILYGSDSPWFDHKESIQWHLNLKLTDSQKEMILSKNARQLLAINL